MKFAKADESALIIAFADLLQRGEITEYEYAQVGQGWEQQVLETLSEEGRKHLKAILDPTLESYYQDRVFRHFYLAGNHAPSEPTRLSTFKGFSKPLEIAKTFVENLVCCPHNYRLALKIEGIFTNFILNEESLKISDRLWVVKESKILISHSFSHENPELDRRIRRSCQLEIQGEEQSNSEEEKLYFVYHCSGLFTNRYASRHVEAFQDELRSLFGILLSSDVVLPFTFPFSYPDPVVVSNFVKDDKTELVGMNSVDSDIKSGLSFIVGKASRHAAGNNLASLLAPAIRLFASPERNRLATAASWIFRANVSPRPINKALEAAIAIEVLLGDRETSDRIGLSKLMANRCAYALARSQSERSALIETFLRFYRVRSEIVHAGRTKVTEEDKGVVTAGVELAGKLLFHEVSLTSDAQ